MLVMPFRQQQNAITHAPALAPTAGGAAAGAAGRRAAEPPNRLPASLPPSIERRPKLLWLSPWPAAGFSSWNA